MISRWQASSSYHSWRSTFKGGTGLSSGSRWRTSWYPTWQTDFRHSRSQVYIFSFETGYISYWLLIGSIDSRDAATTLTVCNLLRHCLEHADKNLRFCPKRNFTISKVSTSSLDLTSFDAKTYHDWFDDWFISLGTDDWFGVEAVQ